MLQTPVGVHGVPPMAQTINGVPQLDVQTMNGVPQMDVNPHIQYGTPQHNQPYYQNSPPGYETVGQGYPPVNYETSGVQPGAMDYRPHHWWSDRWTFSFVVGGVTIFICLGLCILLMCLQSKQTSRKGEKQSSYSVKRKKQGIVQKKFWAAEPIHQGRMDIRQGDIGQRSPPFPTYSGYLDSNQKYAMVGVMPSHV